MITKNNFFDRERLISLTERSLYSLFVGWLYKKWLQKKVKIKPKINALERISNCYSVIGYKTRLMAFFRAKRQFRTVKTIVIL